MYLPYTFAVRTLFFTSKYRIPTILQKPKKIQIFRVNLVFFSGSEMGSVFLFFFWQKKSIFSTVCDGVKLKNRAKNKFFRFACFSLFFFLCFWRSTFCIMQQHQNSFAKKICTPLKSVSEKNHAHVSVENSLRDKRFMLHNIMTK